LFASRAIVVGEIICLCDFSTLSRFAAQEVAPADVIQANDSDEPYFSEQSLESEEVEEEERLARLAKMGGGKDFGGLWGRERR
jgi:hypothetical protein